MSRTNRIAFAALIAVLVAASLGSVAYFGGAVHKPTQVQNVLIIASITGFNDSADHGVPSNPWPVVKVAKGTVVNFTVYNEDKQAHGFQVSHYLDAPIETIAPGQKVSFTIVANETGTFRIYCSIFCSVHWAMQDGELIVS